LDSELESVLKYILLTTVYTWQQL